MQLVVDRFGRVVLPKTVREDLGLSAGDALEVDQRPGCIILWPMPERNVLRRREGVLVYGGTAQEDLREAVVQWRKPRAGKHSAGRV